MKKFLALIAALTLMMTGIALAENVPNPDADTQPEAEPAEKVEYTAPDGQRTFPYALVEAGQNSGFMIREWEFTDSVQAEEPAEHSLNYTALPGTKLLHVRFVTRYCANKGYNSNKQPVAVDRIQGTVVDGTQKEYTTTAFMEGSENSISLDACIHETVECTTHPNSYMMTLSGTEKNFEIKDHDHFALCDFIAEIPEELAGSDMPLYLVVRLPRDTETVYYIQLQ